MQEVFPDSFLLSARTGQIPAESLVFCHVPTLFQIICVSVRIMDKKKFFAKGVDKGEKRWYDSKAVEKRQVFWKGAHSNAQRCKEILQKLFRKGLTSEKKCGRVNNASSLQEAAGFWKMKKFAEKIPKKG